MAKTKKIVRRIWTKNDFKVMKKMARSKAGNLAISKALKRTPGAVAVQAGKYGVSLSMS